MKQLGFDVTLDPATANLSGAFENVTFNIPNPEVRQSFDSSLPHAEEIQADLILSTDPDADRIGFMVRHRGDWVFLTGNEIGILLAHYGIRQAEARGELGADSTIIKTDVTTSLIARLAESKGVQCIGDLLVGFKYIGAEMNRLDTAGKMPGFILGTEESHGYLTGNYARDKDAAGAAIWIAEFAAELKREDMTLVDQLDRIYAAHGYCRNESNRDPATGRGGHGANPGHHGRTAAAAGGGFRRFRRPLQARPLGGADPQPHLSRTDTASRNVLVFFLRNTDETSSMRVTIRPSGTEPKVKMYFEVVGKPCPLAQLDATKAAIRKIGERLEKAVMQHCYRILGIDFPDRGFLLFWQLPLTDKLHYFEIEDDIAALQQVPSLQERQSRLQAMLGFLGANPVEKIDDAFKARFGERHSVAYRHGLLTPEEYDRRCSIRNGSTF